MTTIERNKDTPPLTIEELRLIASWAWREKSSTEDPVYAKQCSDLYTKTIKFLHNHANNTLQPDNKSPHVAR